MKTTLILLATMLLAVTACRLPQDDIVIRTPREKMVTRLDTLSAHGVMYGHQDDTFYGLTWKWEKDRSDTKELLGVYPAVMGFDLGGLEVSDPYNLDGVPFDRIREEAIAHYRRGGVVAFSWHPRNPSTNGSPWDTSDPHAVQKILKQGPQHDRFMNWMKKMAAFLKTLKLPDGRSISFVMRPWHEFNCDWFWWGEKCCTDEEFCQLWAMFQDYMNVELSHSIVWAFAPNLQGNWTKESYMRRYPGNDRVDMLGCDAFQLEGEKQFIASLSADMAFLNEFAQENNKLLAITECGMREMPKPDWWSTVVLPLLDPYPVSYCLAWRSWPEKYFGAATKDAPSADDWRTIKEEHKMLFLNDIATQIMGITGRESSEVIWL